MAIGARGCPVKPCCVPVLLILFSSCLTAAASDQKPASDLPHLSKQTRMDLIRGFDAELVYIRTPFPMGKVGLTIKDGAVSPNGEDLQRLMAVWGPAVKPGDEARITSVVI